MRVAILEDPAEHEAHLANQLQISGHMVTVYATHKELLHDITGKPLDLLMLNWGEYNEAKLNDLKQVRSSLMLSTPVVVICSGCSQWAMLSAIEAGANEYWIKPLHPGEFLARVAMLEKRAHSPASRNGDAVKKYLDYSFDVMRRHITWNGGQAHLSPKLFELAHLFFKNCGVLLSRQQLAEIVWGQRTLTNPRIIDARVSTIRKQLDLDGQANFRLNTVYGRGYLLMQSNPSALTASAGDERAARTS